MFGGLLADNWRMVGGWLATAACLRLAMLKMILWSTWTFSTEKLNQNLESQVEHTELVQVEPDSALTTVTIYSANIEVESSTTIVLLHLRLALLLLKLYHRLQLQYVLANTVIEAVPESPIVICHFGCNDRSLTRTCNNNLHLH